MSHRLDEDTLVTPALLLRFAQEAELEDGDGRYYAIIERSNGDNVDHNPGSPELDPIQIVWARSVLALVNRELHHDGAWVIVFTHPIRNLEALPFEVLTDASYGRFAIMWMDQDGDVQFTLEWVLNETEELEFHDVVASGLHSWAQKCEMAWQTWHLHMREVIDPAEGQTFKRAQGQRPTSLQ